LGTDDNPVFPGMHEASALVVGATSARGHWVFGGCLVRKQLSFPERAVTAAQRVADHDDPDWTEIIAWTGAIAEALNSGSPPKSDSESESDSKPESEP
jgi:hypothetical protein